MAEQPETVETTETQSQQPEMAIVSTSESEGASIPRGAIAFGVLMIIGYAFYFFMIWSEVVARGGQ